MAQDSEGEARRITVIALVIVLLLGALDQTIVSTAMPRIVAQQQHDHQGDHGDPPRFAFAVVRHPASLFAPFLGRPL